LQNQDPIVPVPSKGIFINIITCPILSHLANITLGTSELSTPGTTPHAEYHYPITTNVNFPSTQQPSVQQPHGIMQIQQPAMQAQQAVAPTAMQTQNPVMPVQPAAMPVQQPVVMAVQQPTMALQQSLVAVQQQAVMPPTQQSAIVHGHPPTTLQIQPQQQPGGVATPLSNLQRMALLPTPLVGSPNSIPAVPVTQQQMIQQQQQLIPSASTVNAAHYSTTSYVTHNTQ